MQSDDFFGVSCFGADFEEKKQHVTVLNYTIFVESVGLELSWATLRSPLFRSGDPCLLAGDSVFVESHLTEYDLYSDWCLV